MEDYTFEELSSIYELGRLYFEMGYLAPAERIFSGLSVVDKGKTPARIGVGLVRLERGLYDDGAQYFRAALEKTPFQLQAKLGLVLAFIGSEDHSRARQLMNQIRKENIELQESPELRSLFEALVARTK